jgi:hypothetical protein
MTQVMKIEEQEIAQDPFFAIVQSVANNPDADVEKMERVLAMYQAQQDREAKRLFNSAMSKCQSEIGRIAANKKNQQTRSEYADYAAIDRVIRPVYIAHGCSLSFGTDDSPKPDHVRVVCNVGHESGHTERRFVDMPADGKGAKGNDVMTKTYAAGSAVQYGMRYLAKMIFNIAIGEDDDGNMASASTRYITDDQFADLIGLMDELGDRLDRPKFKKWLSSKGVDDFAKIPAKMYGEVIAMLERKRSA